jgi:hypothetical protein
MNLRGRTGGSFEEEDWRVRSCDASMAKRVTATTRERLAASDTLRGA